MSEDAQVQTEVQAEPQAVPENHITFHDANGNVKGRIVHKDGKFCFEGDADASAEHFAQILSTKFDKAAQDATHNAQEMRANYELVAMFSSLMLQRMTEKQAEGRTGWYNLTPDQLYTMLLESVTKRDPVNIANFCAFLWGKAQMLKQAEAAQQQQPQPQADAPPTEAANS